MICLHYTAPSVKTVSLSEDVTTSFLTTTSAGIIIKGTHNLVIMVFLHPSGEPEDVMRTVSEPRTVTTSFLTTTSAGVF